MRECEIWNLELGLGADRGRCEQTTRWTSRSAAELNRHASLSGALELGTWNAKCEIRKFEMCGCETWNLELGTRNVELRNLKLEICGGGM